MKVLLILTLCILNGCAVSSNTTIEYMQIFSENRSMSGIENNKNIGIGDYFGEELFERTRADISILSNGEIHTKVGSDTFQGRGKVLQCEGYKNQCLDIDTFKFMIRKNYDFSTSAKWSWGDYQYDAVEVIGVSKEDLSYSIQFSVSKKRGLLYFIIAGEDYSAIYVLASPKGFWAEP
ncbi:hypothetical protein [Alteromonas oceanisediminis]|uniref:hypothetical protein n=1 Tax=Alteromonas oceanisediminis TaxID=2836180 RepID=UPI001BDB3039|nr:hypothetical protein [Alteromonas oceanisediminis]MBT0587737.1 hypothetical protein [Alteromonas oceanisediminis]